MIVDLNNQRAATAEQEKTILKFA